MKDEEALKANQRDTLVLGVKDHVAWARGSLLTIPKPTVHSLTVLRRSSGKGRSGQFADQK
jgi:hypothetical protein